MTDYRLAATEAQERWLGKLARERRKAQLVRELVREVERLREQLVLADRAVEAAGPAVECGRGEAGQCRKCAALDGALAAYEAAREGDNQ